MSNIISREKFKALLTAHRTDTEHRAEIEGTLMLNDESLRFLGSCEKRPRNRNTER